VNFLARGRVAGQWRSPSWSPRLQCIDWVLPWPTTLPFYGLVSPGLTFIYNNCANFFRHLNLIGIASDVLSRHLLDVSWECFLSFSFPFRCKLLRPNVEVEMKPFADLRAKNLDRGVRFTYKLDSFEYALLLEEIGNSGGKGNCASGINNAD
jgi:hypothetical protein